MATKLIYKPIHYNNIQSTETLIEMSEEPKKYDCNTTIWQEEYKKALQEMDPKERYKLMFGTWNNNPSQESPMEFRKGIQVSIPAITAYMYNGYIYKWVDGDTIEVVLDLGLKIAHRITIRLYGLNAPEKNTEEGKQLIELLNKEFSATSNIVVQTIKDKKEKYGRYLGIIYCNNININDYLISKNLAKILNY